MMKDDDFGIAPEKLVESNDDIVTNPDIRDPIDAQAVTYARGIAESVDNLVGSINESLKDSDLGKYFIIKYPSDNTDHSPKLAMLTSIYPNDLKFHFNYVGEIKNKKFNFIPIHPKLSNEGLFIYDKSTKYYYDISGFLNPKYEREVSVKIYRVPTSSGGNKRRRIRNRKSRRNTRRRRHRKTKRNT